MSPPRVSAVLITREKHWPSDAYPRDFDFQEILVECQCPGIHRRFEIAQQAANDIVYVQDDDCAINVPQLWKHYRGRLTCAMTQGHLEMYEGSGTTLIGWGAFFPKSLIDFARWYARYPNTPIPSHEYDRVFTYLAQPFDQIVMPIRQFHRGHAMSRDNPDHYKSRQRIWDMLREVGR